MKNVTVSLDDETHRRARIRAAELGTSLSALVKDYLVRLSESGADTPDARLREAPMSYTAIPASLATPAKTDGPPWLVDGKWVYTRDGKPRQPGALRGKVQMSEDFEEWPEDILGTFEAWGYGSTSNDT